MTAGLSRRTLLAGLLAPAPERGWLRLPDLPEAFGGQFAGVHRGALIVAGGSRFPVPLEEGGTKKWFADVFVLTGRGGPWRRFMLPRPLGYGGSVSHSRGVLLIGGSSEEGHTASCLWLRWNGQSIETEDAPQLPVPLSLCGAAALGDTAYVLGGHQSPSAAPAETTLYTLDLRGAGAAWKAAGPFPGPGRILASMAAAAGRILVAGGATIEPGSSGTPVRGRYLSDAWSYEPVAGWRALPPLPELTCAAPSFGFPGGFAIAGGSDGTLDRQAAALGARHPGFSRNLKVFDLQRQRWSIAGGMPFSLVTTTAALWDGLAVIPGGETRPGQRSSAVWALPLAALGRA